MKAVDDAVSGGAFWANSAGNEAKSSWSGAFTDTEPEPDGFLEFATPDETNGVFLFAGEKLTAQLRWDDSWGAAAIDLDLELYNSALALVAVSVNDQSSGIFPYPESTEGHRWTA